MLMSPYKTSANPVTVTQEQEQETAFQAPAHDTTLILDITMAEEAHGVPEEQLEVFQEEKALSEQEV